MLRIRRLHSLTWAVPTIFNSANLLPTGAEQHHTFRTPSIATGFSVYHQLFVVPGAYM
jgi:hypothetical protein